MDEIADQKKELGDSLCDLLESYMKKYIKKLYEKCSSYKELQGHLTKVAHWEKHKKLHEYKKFIKWSERKKNIDDNEFNKMCVTYFLLCIKILLQNNVPDNTHAHSTQYNVFYNCMRSVCKHLYNDPTSIHNPDVHACISKSLQQNLNIPSILRLVSLPDYTNYDFSKDKETNDSLSKENIDDSLSTENILEKNNLRYISSDEFDNYRHLKNNDEPDVVESDIDDIKHISLK